VVRQPEIPLKNRLRVLRAERGWSQAELADRLDVSRQTVNAIETEKYDPSLPLAFKIARMFDLPIESIFEPDEESGSSYDSGRKCLICTQIAQERNPAHKR
jgi:putative transcriptional regulator